MSFYIYLLWWKVRKGVNLQLFTRLVYLKSLRQKNTTNQLPGSWSWSTIRPVASAHRGARKCYRKLKQTKLPKIQKKNSPTRIFYIAFRWAEIIIFRSLVWVDTINQACKWKSIFWAAKTTGNWQPSWIPSCSVGRFFLRCRGAPSNKFEAISIFRQKHPPTLRLLTLRLLTTAVS